MNVCDDPVALNDWYVVAYVDELGLGKSEQTQLLGEELELMRERDGRFRCLWHKRDGTAEPLEHIRQRYGFVWVSLGRPTRDILTIAEFDDGEPRRFIHRGRIGVPS